MHRSVQRTLRKCLERSPGNRRALLVVVIVTSSIGCEPSPTTSVERPIQGADTAVAGPVFFKERSEISSVLSADRLAKPDFEMPEIMGRGCAMADLNGDNRLDLITLPAGASTDSGVSSGNSVKRCRILSQDSAWEFREVSDEADLEFSGVGMGCFCGDIDNDGDLDAVTTSSQGAQIFRNDGNFSFSNITETSGLKCRRWTVAAVFFDYDRDGWLDLFVVNYVDYFSGSECHDATGRRDFCGPNAFTGTSDQLFRNLGHSHPGTFEEVTVSSGLAGSVGKGLGAICSDLNGDRLPDIYVANDMEPNFLWIQGPDGIFKEEANRRGCAVDFQGRPQASMGTLLDDIDGDGRLDIFLTHLRGETNTLYRQAADGIYQDETSLFGLGEPSRDHTGFGVVSCDLDLDGSREIIVANGRVMRSPYQTTVSTSGAQLTWTDYAEKNQIFRVHSESPRVYEELPSGDPFLQPEEVSRGLSSGDIDNDGDCDLLLSNADGSCRVYENGSERHGNWLQVRLLDPDRHRDAIGARIRIHCGQTVHQACLLGQSGYLSNHDLRLNFGVGASERYDFIEVEWPEVTFGVERFEPGPTNQQITLIKGAGQQLPTSNGKAAQP